MKINKTKRNPYGLTRKRQLVIDSVVEDVSSGKGMRLDKAVERIYSTTNPNSASSIANELWKNDDFRAALTNGLVKKGMIGPDSRVEKGLDEGLEAYTKRPQMVGRDEKGKPVYEYVEEKDFRTRLAYIQEINKIAGVYAPEKKESRKMTLNIDLTPEEINKRIDEISQELKNE